MHGLTIMRHRPADLGRAQRFGQAVADEMSPEIIGEAAVVLEGGGEAAGRLAGLEHDGGDAPSLEVERGSKPRDAGPDDDDGLGELRPEPRLVTFHMHRTTP